MLTETDIKTINQWLVDNGYADLAEWAKDVGYRLKLNTVASVGTETGQHWIDDNDEVVFLPYELLRRLEDEYDRRNDGA